MTAPVHTPSAPASPDVSQSGPFGVDDAIRSISESAIAQTLAEQSTPSPDATKPPAPSADEPATPAAREDGATWNANAKRWQKPDGSFAEGAAPADATTPTPEPDAPAVPLPDGMVAVHAVTDRDLATTFKVLDAEGELAIPDVTIEFNANGKVRKEPLDKVVRLAERGVYNEEREQAVIAQKQHTETITHENQQLRQMLQQAEFEREQLLASDEAYLMARARYEQENTPEAKLDRMRQQQDQQQQAQLYQQAVQTSNQYFEATVMPAVEQIATNLSTVTPDEIGARLVLLTNHLRVPMPDGDSFIPPRNHQAVNDIILREIVPWAQSLHEQRDHSTRQQREDAARQQRDADARQQKAQTDAQKAKGLIGRQTRPRAGQTNTSSTRESPPARPIRTVDDAEQAALRDTLAAVL